MNTWRCQVFLGIVFRVPLAEHFGKIELMGTRTILCFLGIENEMGGKKYTVTTVFVG